ncbi:MAG: diguanylate cyclase [Candidatus Izemoplasma sp.]
MKFNKFNKHDKLLNLENSKNILTGMLEFNIKDKKISFSPGAIRLFRLTEEFESGTWYLIDDYDNLLNIFLRAMQNEDVKSIFNKEQNKEEFRISLIIELEHKVNQMIVCDAYINNGVLYGVVFLDEHYRKFISMINYGLENSSIGVWWIEKINGKFVFVNTDSSRAIYGLSPESPDTEPLYTDSWTGKANKLVKLYPEYKHYFEEDKRKITSVISGEIEEFDSIFPWLNRESELVWLEVRARTLYIDKEGKVELVVGATIDVTKKIQKEQEFLKLQIERKKLIEANKVAVELSGLLVWSRDYDNNPGGELYIGNETYCNTLGLKCDKDGKVHLSDFRKSGYDDEKGKETMKMLISKYNQIMLNFTNEYLNVIVKHRNLITNEAIFLEHHTRVEERYDNGDIRRIGGFIKNITEELKLKERTDYLIHYDYLSGLKNRYSFEKFQSEINKPASYSLVVADIDGLKLINDSFGHLKGDEVIIYISNNFIKYFGKDSDIFRIGGDEIAIISSLTNEKEVLDRIINMRKEFTEFTEMTNIEIGISVGYEIVINNSQTYRKAFISAENFMYRRKLNDRLSRKGKVMTTLLNTLNEKSEETKEHSIRLGKYAIRTLIELGYKRISDAEDLELLCKLHDIGKITIAEEILSKPGKLNTEEFDKIKEHSEAGYKIVKNLVDSDRIAKGVLYHHERVDGTGYPFGIKGNKIPLFAKILSVCDAYDVIVTGRVYNKAKSSAEAIKEIRNNIGTQFDNIVANAFIRIIENNKDYNDL